MNKDTLSGNWKKAKGDLKQWWGKLTDNDILYVDGKVDKLLGILQERYGWTREQAEKEVNQHFEVQGSGTTSQKDWKEAVRLTGRMQP